MIDDFSVTNATYKDQIYKYMKIEWVLDGAVFADKKIRFATKVLA
jgi:hypothetical protein